MTQNFSVLTSVEDAAAWIDAHVPRLAAEDVALDAAVGRVPARDVPAGTESPPYDWAALDGLAVRADETAGASAYNPLSFRLTAAGDALPVGAGVLLNAGDPLPDGADAVIALERVQQDHAGRCEIIEAVASGSGIEPRGSHFARGATLVEAGRPLSPPDIGLLAATGAERAPVVARPRVRCLLVERAQHGMPSPGTAHDPRGPLLRALIERDGGTIVEPRCIGRDRAAIRAALAGAASDIVIVAGGTGRGANDATAAALAEAGELAGHGVALDPGETAGFGRTGAGTPVFLLPGAPAACLWAYEFLAGRAIRRRGGRDPAPPLRTREMTTVRKIVSRIGMTEVVPVRCLGRDRLEPRASFAEAGLGAAASADGVVVVPEGSEGFPAGAPVTAHLWAG